MVEHGLHRVQLGVTRGGVTTGAVDLLHDDGRLGDAQTQSPVLFRDQRGQQSLLGDSVHELLGVGTLQVFGSPIFVAEVGAEIAHGLSEFCLPFSVLVNHAGLPSQCQSRSNG